MSRATHARFLARQAAEREAELDAPLTSCALCGAVLTRRQVRDGQVVQLGPGSVCVGCNADAD